MKTANNPWRLWIDTGGTFTDCLAYDPDGVLHRAKVLSSSALRGKIIATAGDGFEAHFNWPVELDIFRGYQFRLLHQEHVTATVERVDLAQKRIFLSKDADPSWQGAFEITAHEEAPVLAARLVTQTPLNEPLPLMEMRLGSTKGTNAMLERKGADTTLILTQGFGDLLAIDTQQRPELFALNIQKHLPYYSRVIEVAERINAQGEVILPLTGEAIAQVIRQLRQTNTAAVAIALMHSYRNPAHERKLKEAIQEAGYPYVSGSAELTPSIKLLPRTKTALVNAYLSPAMEQYLQAVKSKIVEGSTRDSIQSSLKLMTSAGGLVDADLYHPKDSLLSGPAGGVVGAASMMRQIQSTEPGIQQILAFDMGGTSTDVSRYDGLFDYTFTTRVGDIQLSSPTLAIETVAAGGGSLCYFDGHKLSVGPESAGAHPGPACYGFGGPLTLTDVNLLLGSLQEDSFGIPINKKKARQALAALQEKLTAHHASDYQEEDLLMGFLRIANEKMTEAVRSISVRKGYDPAAHTLLAFGGAGGQHACQIARLLGMQQIIVPYDAGLLSAFGMGQAVIERFAIRQVLQPLPEALPGLAKAIDKLKEEALQALEKEGCTGEQLTIRLVRLFLRFAGQEATLEIDYDPQQDISQAFRRQYEAQYGHWLDGQVIELESIKVVAATRAPEVSPPAAAPEPYTPTPDSHIANWIENQWQPVPTYRWEDLSPGAFMAGPALVGSQNSTTFVEAGWHFRLNQQNMAVLDYQPTAVKDTQVPGLEAVQLALFTNRFESIAREMGALLERTSFSVNVKERLDFSCALLDPAGELVVNAPHIPVHLGSLGICVRRVREVIPMEAGDVVMTNHPAYGGSHLPDITLISPVYAEGKLAGYVANRAHHAEIGGKRPGSMPPDATSLAEEGVVIAPSYLVRRGQPQWEAVRALLTQGSYPTRSVAENMADLNGALASIQSGVAALQKLYRHFGLSQVLHYMQALKDYAAACLTAGLATFTQDSYQATEYLDDGTPLTVTCHLREGQVQIDFSGSGGVHPGNLNATQAIVNSAVIYVLRLLVPQSIPLNEGLMQQVKLILPVCLLNPPFPDDPQLCPAVVGGNTETSQRLVDTLLKALRLAACSQGTMNNLLFGDDTFGYYETIGGGTGAGEGFAGADAVHQHMTNTRMTDPEVLEFRYPVRVEQFAIRRQSGGQGQWRGGNGIVRQLTFLKPVELTILSQHRKETPYGLAGGQTGQAGRQYIIRTDGTTQTLAGIDQARLLPGESIVVETPGGGGYGETSAD